MQPAANPEILCPAPQPVPGHLFSYVLNLGLGRGLLGQSNRKAASSSIAFGNRWGDIFSLPLLLCLALAPFANARAATPATTLAPVKVIFDTDIGNDVDDVLALSMLHALQTRGDCELLAVTITKPDDLAGPFVDALNTFYGRPGLPI